MKQSITKLNENGFSLIEIVAVVAIVAVIGVAGFFGYQNYHKSHVAHAGGWTYLGSNSGVATWACKSNYGNLGQLKVAFTKSAGTSNPSYDVTMRRDGGSVLYSSQWSFAYFGGTFGQSTVTYDITKANQFNYWLSGRMVGTQNTANIVGC